MRRPRRGPGGRPPGILFIDPGGERGGAEVVVERLALGAVASGFRPVVLTLSPGSWPSELRLQGIDAYSMPRRGSSGLKRGLRIMLMAVRLIRSHGIAIVHASCNSSLQYATVAAKVTGARLVWHIHDPQPVTDWRSRLFIRTLRLLSPDFIVFGNPTCQAAWLPILGSPAPDNALIIPGVEADDLLRGSAGRGRQALGLAPDVPVVSMFARMAGHKGHEHLIRAAGHIRQRVPMVRVVIGSGPGSTANPVLDELVDELDLGGDCHSRRRGVGGSQG